MSKFNVGDKVRYIGKKHNDMPEFYPPVGTIGTVVNQLNECDNVYIQWEKASTSKDDYWYCNRHDIELVKDTDMTNEEIWEMLRPKMEKNGLKPMGTCTKWKNCVPQYFYTYSEDDVHNAITIAYRSGCERAMKGRPFKIGEKKKKGGHWEPIDIEQVIKGGYKVVEDCLGWHYKYLGTYKKDEDGKFYQWVEDDE